MNILKKLKDGAVMMCCGKDKCPVMRFTEDKQIRIEDDYGNHVIMEVDQAKLITEALKELSKSKS